MTPEALETLIIEEQNFDNFRAAFANLTDKDRRALSKTAQNLYKYIINSQNSFDYKETSGVSDRLQKLLKKAHKASFTKTKTGSSFTQAEWVGSLRDRALLALFAVAPVSPLKTNNIWSLHSIEDRLFHILADRKPDWVDDWLDYHFEQEWPRLSFPFVLKLIENDIATKPTSDAYITLYANHLMRPYNQWNHKESIPPISKQLKATPYLLEDVYRVFHVESNAFNTNSWFKTGASDEHETWTEAFLKMGSDGTLDRTRLLDESLATLTADLKSNQLSGIAKFHKAMKATPDELKQREASYRALLASPVPPIARFGLDQLSTLHKAKKLDLEPFLAELPIIFSLSVKSHPMAAVKFLTRLLKTKTPHFESAAQALSTALTHENTDVQAAALETLETHGDKLSPELKEALGTHVNFIAPHLSARLEKLAGNTVQASPLPAEDTDDTIERISGLTAQQKEAWGLNALEAMPFKLHPITENITQLSVLHTTQPINPIKSQDALLSAIASFIENSSDKAEGERIADGIACIPRIENEDFTARVKPLMHRLDMDVDAESWASYTPLGGGALADLIKTYLRLSHRRDPDDFKKDWADRTPAERESERLDGTMSIHFRELAKSFSLGKTPGRLCTPTHEGGWICPLIWVDRLAKFDDTAPIDQIDLSYSLLRLAPDNRKEAAAKIEGLPNDLRDLAAFVLGLEDKPNITAKSDIGVWMSAVRARNPLKDWSDLFSHLNLAEIPPGAVAPRPVNWSVTNENMYNERLKIEKPPVQDTRKKIFRRFITIAQTKLPASLMGEPKKRDRYSYEDCSAAERTWYATLFPLYPAMAHKSALNGITSRIDEKANSFEPVHGAINALFQKNRPWGELGHLILALAFLGRDADAQALSIDALIEGTESGQLDTDCLAAVLTRLFTSNWVKLNRPGPAMLQAAQISPLHAFAMLDVISKWLPSIDPKRRSLGDVLDVALQCAALANTSLSEEFRLYLETFSGSSKAAKTAEALLKVPPGRDTNHIQNLAIAARLNYLPND